jgi:hypothetical protein
MSWERRKQGSGRYYTRSVRVPGSGGRIRREYVGGGDLGALRAGLDAEERLDRQREAQQRREEEARQRALYAAIFAPLDVLDAACTALVRRELEAAGYHVHKRQWRKRRNHDHGNTDQEA